LAEYLESLSLLLRCLPFPPRQTIRLSNPSKLPAKFEVQPQEEGSMGLATYTVEPSSGGVPAMGEQVCIDAMCKACLPILRYSVES